MATTGKGKKAIGGSRVERWRGGVGFDILVSGFPRLRLNSRMPCSVSTSRSSNRTGGFPASGFRTRFRAVAHGKERVFACSRTRPNRCSRMR